MKKGASAWASAGMAGTMNKKFFEASMDFSGSHAGFPSFEWFFVVALKENAGMRRSVRVFL